MGELKCEITLPEEIVSFLGISKKKMGLALQRELTLHFFARNTLNFGQARKLTKMSVWNFIEFKKEAGELAGKNKELSQGRRLSLKTSLEKVNTRKLPSLFK